MTTRSDVAALRLFESPAAQSSLGFFRAGHLDFLYSSKFPIVPSYPYYPKIRPL